VESCDIVSFSSAATARRRSRDGGDDVLMLYRAPTSVDDVVQQRTLTVRMNGNNYIHRMHDLLRLEEYTQAKLIAEYVH